MSSGGDALVPSSTTEEGGESTKSRRRSSSARRSPRRSSSSRSLQGSAPAKSKTLEGFLKTSEDGSKSPKKLSGSRSVGGDMMGRGEVYTRADGKKVRRVKKSNSMTLKDNGENLQSQQKSLTGFLEGSSSGDRPRAKIGASASVAGDRVAGRESSLTGEIYTRADGKKVRRVKKSSLSSSSSVAGGEEQVEIITRPDGTKVKRIRRIKPKDGSASSVSNGTSSTAAKDSSSTSEKSDSIKSGLSGFIGSSSPSATKKKFSGSHSVAGDKHVEGEIYVRADGKKVRRVRKVKPSPSGSVTSDTSASSSLSGFLDSDTSDRVKGGAATVIGDVGGTGRPITDAERPETEIYVRPDGTKVRRIRRTAVKTTNDAKTTTTEKKEGLDGFLTRKETSSPRKKGGSASVAGDQIAVSKESSLTGEVYVRADGKKVRRVKKSSSAASGTSNIGPDDQVEIITRPDGTKVRRIRRAKPKKGEDSSQLSGFLDSQPKKASMGGGATVAGDRLTDAEAKKAEGPTASSESDDAKKKESLDGFLGKLDSKPKKIGGSASVAGDQIALSKESSLTGEIYVRADGKKVRRVVKKPSQVQPGDQVEIVTRPDGTKVRRIRRAKKPAEATGSSENGDASLGGFLGQSGSEKKGSSATVAGDLQKEKFISELMAKKYGGSVDRRLLRQLTAGDQVEIITRPDGTKVRRIRRSANSARQNSEEAKAEPTLGSLLSGQEANAARKSSAATVAGDDISGKASLKIPVGQTIPQSSTKAAISPEDEEISSKFRKMLRLGMPEGAVVQKMAGEGVPQHIQDAVLSGNSCSDDVGASSSAVGAPPTTSSRPSLSSEDEITASKYRKMVKMGMPEGAVMQKMSTDEVPQYIQDAVLAGEEPSATTTNGPAEKVSKLSSEEEEIAATYRKMLKMGMPDGAVMQKMGGDGIAQNIQDSVMAREVPASESAAISVQSNGSTIPDGMVLVSKEQAEKTIPEGMMAVPKGQPGTEGIPDGYVLVPKDQVKSDQIILMSPEKSLNKTKLGKDVDISGANIVSMEDLQGQVEKLKIGDGKNQPRFLLQALPEDEGMEDDFIRKNLLPKSSAPEATAAPTPAPAPAPAAPSSSVAEILAQMSSMGGEFDAEKMGELLGKLEAAEKRQAKLEKQLAAAGVAIAEDIDYDICIKKVEQIGKRMNEIGGSDVTHPDKEEQNRLREEYFKLEQEMEKYNSALLLTDEYVAEQDRLEKKWESDNAPGNLEALKKLRRHMPVEVRNMSEAQLTSEPSPNGKYLPNAIAKKFKRTNVLQIIRRSPDDIVRMHPSTLENMRVTGLTLTERRALYEHLRGVGPQWKAMKAEKMTERKWTWYNMMKSNFKENLASWQRHVDQYGPPGAHPYATRANPNEGCPLIGKQCPLKADKMIDYDVADYGYQDGDVYEVSEVRKADADDPGAKAMQEALELMKEKKANERGDALKKHYKGKLLQVSKANGSCEQMDEMMDKIEYGMMKWLDDIINMGDDESKLTEDVKKKELGNFTDVLGDCKLSTLDFCGRSGMQLSGKRTDEERPDPRSIVECSLALEVAEAFDVFAKFVKNRLKKTDIIDTRVNSTIDMLQNLLRELNERNLKTISALGGQRLDRSRKLKTQADMENEIKAKQKEVEPPPAAPETGGGPPLPGPPRAGLMDALKAGRGGRAGGGGRGDLLAALGRGRGGRGGAPGRGDLLSGIQGRGRGRGGGGRGSLLDSIAARGRGGGGGRGGGDA
eukprot:CAMPEP_0113508630 /NCGR_PEP_ID=MMETSP0014_2-20120614/37128_1 /TAXON_ID=2857 /ORGANISM="Nitzschia sp." /LENGTH=1734 /DNA_ID=CAMNT_0000404373 /DNA_START=378 /DNA_END=5580 /DNA_ORIENTATION=- /assembly_acc=CAM_ASM_000159